MSDVESLRQKTLAQLVKAGAPRSEAQQIVDLAFYGADKALDALGCTVLAAPSKHITTAAAMIGASLAISRLEQMLDEIKTAAADAGVNLKKFKVVGRDG